MKGQNFLGIYIAKDNAVVALANVHSDKYQLQDYFSVSLDDAENKSFKDLLDLITEQYLINMPQVKDPYIAVAVDSSLIMQHKVHSEFTEPKQIAQTIKFDAEEALATNINELVFGFSVESSDQTGSEVDIFTTEKKVLNEIIDSLQKSNLDPVAVEPDIFSLERFIRINCDLTEDQNKIAALFSKPNGYIIGWKQQQEKPIITRSFMAGHQNVNIQLTKQIVLSTSNVQQNFQMERLFFYNSSNDELLDSISDQLTVKPESIDLEEMLKSIDSVKPPVDMVKLAIAFGAACSIYDRKNNLNFRNDYLPFEGRKIKLQKAFRLISLSVLILAVSFGVYFQMMLMAANGYRKQLNNKFQNDYASAMMGKSLPDRSNPITRLKAEYKHIKDAKSGQLSLSGNSSASTKLALLLEVINSSAKATNLNIESVNITARSITVSGSTSSRPNTIKFFNEVKKHFDITSDEYKSKGGPDTFSITLEPKK